jgi:hypothetical protein
VFDDVGCCDGRGSTDGTAGGGMGGQAVAFLLYLMETEA